MPGQRRQPHAFSHSSLMFSHRIKRTSFVLEGLNAAATTVFFNYFFFHMRDQFGFTNLGNLALCAINGGVYCVAVWFAGRYAQQHGYLVALRHGFLIMGTALLVGGGYITNLSNTVQGQTAMMILWTLGMSFTWPALEAIASEGEPPVRLQKLIGIYNVIWSTAGASAYFLGGAMMERFGARTIFVVPAAIHFFQLAMVFLLEREHRRDHAPNADGQATAASVQRHGAKDVSTELCRLFLRMAWIANPFAYVAMNALVPVIPKLAERFGLGPMLAGFFCSTWLFARSASFVVLWLWPGWHYRFRWLVGSYAAMSICFLAILLGQRLWILFVGQLVFGFAVGLIYYSSLYYSMDVGETKGEHGGFHEAAIGAGICAGPAVGALSLRFFPALPNMNAWAVAALLIAGLGWLLLLRQMSRSTGSAGTAAKPQR